VKCRKPGLRGRNSGAKEQIRNAVAHLFRRLVRERDSENRLRRHAVGNQIGHTECDGARFARSRTGENEHGAFDCFGRAALFWVQFVKKIQHLPAVVEDAMPCDGSRVDGAAQITGFFSSVQREM
jgi:hypothetical protein